MKNVINVPKFLAISAIALAIPFGAIAAGRGDKDCGPRDGGRANMEMMRGGGMAGLRGIDLSADQVKQLASLREGQKKVFAEKFMAMREQRDALHKLVMSDAYTPAAAAEIIANKATVQSELAQLRADQANALYKILTPEQRTRMQQNELTGGGMKGHGGKGHGHRR